MNTQNYTAFWHKASFDHFMQERLPQLLAERMPLAAYRFEATGTYTGRVTVAVDANAQAVEIEYTGLPQPDETGVFMVNNERRTVVPQAMHTDLDRAEIKCVGEQLLDLFASRLGVAPPDLPWDEALLRAWLPLDKWMADFMLDDVHGQFLDPTNWLAEQTHLRRLTLTDRTQVIMPGRFDYVCPFEMPEGPNFGRIFTIARGAAIRDGKLVMIDDQPEARLGLSASMIPCLEHDDPYHLLMGANMMRQWLPYDRPEPALVQTGNEPSVAGFWCGRNLLTAFIPWGIDTFEDGIVLSASGARHLSDSSHTVEPGDKLSNRHGIKGVISRILPDDQMPRRADGTPVELIFSSVSQLTRMTFGQVREAVLGRIAQAAGQPVLASPFHAPKEADMRQRLADAGLPLDGMEELIDGAKRQPLAQRCTVGWVYWGRTVHLVKEKLDVSVDNAEQAQRQTALEYQTLRGLGTYETIREHFNARAAERPDSSRLVQRIATSAIPQAEPPTPRFAVLRQRLAAAGIDMNLIDGQLHFHLGQPRGETITLARPVLHPWLNTHQLAVIGAFPALWEAESLWPSWQPERQTLNGESFTPMPAYKAVVEANARLARLLKSGAPQTLTEQAYTQLETCIHAYFDALLTPTDAHFDNRVLFSGRTVLAPGAGLRFDQVGLPEEMAWALFAPRLTRELGDARAVQNRTAQAAQTLDALMARQWVILHRIPSIMPTTFLAFHSVRVPERVLRLHPFACRLLDADFDGDQAAVYLPVTDAGQQEAGDLLSIAGHLTRDPGLLKALAPRNEAMWGLAHLSLSQSGRSAIEQLVGAPIKLPDEFITQASLIETLQSLLAEQGAEPTLARLENLMQRGFEVASYSGISMSPFVGAGLTEIPTPEQDEPERWALYAEQMAEQVAASTDYTNDLGPFLLAVKSGARGQISSLARLIAPYGVVNDAHGRPVIVRHGYRDGLAAQEMLAIVAEPREQLASLWRRWEQTEHASYGPQAAKSFHVLARARQAQHPGVVFAHAAAIGEVDPLVDVDSRLFVGLAMGI